MTDDIAAVAGFARQPHTPLDEATQDIAMMLREAGHPDRARHRAAGIVQIAHLDPERDAVELIRSQLRPSVLDEDAVQRIARVVRGVQQGGEQP